MAKATSKATPKKRHIALTGASAATEIADDVAAFTGIVFTAAQWEVVQQMLQQKLRRSRWQEDR
jgi:glycerol-3-phosphate dehydrogenase